MNIHRLLPRLIACMGLLSCALVVASGNSDATAADTFQWDAVGPSPKNWLALQINDNGTKMVGIADYPYTTSDSGVTWTQRTVITGNPWGLNGVALSGDGTRVAIVAGGATPPNGYSYTSSNSGVTWTQGYPNPGFQHISGSNSGQYLAAAARPCCLGANQGLFLSNDYGATFSQVNYSRFQKTAISNNGNYILATGPDGLFYSTNGGASFSSITVPGATAGWGGVAISGDGSKWYIAGGGLGLMESTNQGTSWTVKVNDIALADVDVSTNGQSIIAGGNTKLVISIDGGATWDQQTTVRDYRAVSVSNDGSKFAAAVYGGSLYVSTELATTTTSIATTTTSTTATTTTTPVISPATSTTVAVNTAPVTNSNSSTSGGSTSNTTKQPLTSVPSSTTVVSSTTSTVAPAEIAGESISASPGEVKAQINGESVETELSRDDNYIVAEIDAVQVKLRLIEEGGSQKSLDDEGNLRIEQGDSIEVSLEGMGIGSVTNIHLFSTPVNVGEIQIVEGKPAIGVFKAPAVDDGDHRIVINGVTAAGEAITVVLGVKVGSVGDSAPIRLVFLVLLGLAAGAAIVIPARRRSAKSI